MLNGYELVEVVKATSRQVAHYQAELLAAARESAYCPQGFEDSPPERTERPQEYAADEIRLALTLTRRAADDLVGTAFVVVERTPDVWAALRAGRIDLPRARVLAEETSTLPEDTCRQVVDQILPVAAELTTGQLRIRVRKLAITVDPDAADRRQTEALTRRRLEHGLDSDGTATLAGRNLPPDRAASAAARIDALARAAKRAGDTRTMDELRADLYLDILNGRPVPDGSGGVELVVPLATLAGLSERPGEIKGWGPVLAEVARKITDNQHDATWRFSVTDEQGGLVAHGRLRRRPTSRQAAFVKARDRAAAHRPTGQIWITQSRGRTADPRSPPTWASSVDIATATNTATGSRCSSRHRGHSCGGRASDTPTPPNPHHPTERERHQPRGVALSRPQRAVGS